MRHVRFIPLLAALLPASASPAAAERIELLPAGSEVAFRAYGLGLLPLDGRFTRFRGWLRFARPDHADCMVELLIEVPSLTMGHESVRDEILGPAFMDAARFPGMTYRGACEASNIQGMLTMHGVTRPFALALDWRAREVVAEGNLRRGDWGVAGMPILAGPTIRIRVTTPLTTTRADR